jgi:Domain of unknown function (DUF4249)
MKKFLFLLITFSFFSCEKDIDIELDDTTESLVVDGSIENGAPPLVILSKSLNYFSKIDPEILQNSFVRNAEVYISDGVKRHRLKEDSIVSSTGNVIYYYSNDPANLSTAIIGSLNTSYELEINAEGKQYKASTTIPSISRRIDSLWWEAVQITKPEDSNLVKMIIRATDQPGLGDYIRYFTKTNQEPFYPGFNSVFDDQVIDGTTYTFPVDRGVNKNFEIKEDDVFFSRGDTVILKLSDIDRVNFDFWRTFEFNFQSIGNPFSSPVKVLGNISNGALGYFGGYAAQFRTLIIPPR